MRQNLADIDTDQDGALTQEEVEAGMQSIMANFGGSRGGGIRTAWRELRVDHQ